MGIRLYLYFYFVFFISYRLMSTITKNYISGVLFRPPQPLFHYPSDIDAEDGTLMNNITHAIFDKTGVPCIFD